MNINCKILFVYCASYSIGYLIIHCAYHLTVYLISNRAYYLTRHLITHQACLSYQIFHHPSGRSNVMKSLVGNNIPRGMTCPVNKMHSGR